MDVHWGAICVQRGKIDFFPWISYVGILLVELLFHDHKHNLGGFT